MFLRQYATSSHVPKAICNLVAKLHCKLLQKLMPTYVYQAQRIFNIREEEMALKKAVSFVIKLGRCWKIVH